MPLSTGYEAGRASVGIGSSDWLGTFFMNQNECPIMVYDPPKGTRSHGWSVGFSPLGVPNSYAFFHRKANAMRFARQQIKAPRCISAVGAEIPWDVTVSWKSEGEAREVECWDDGGDPGVHDVEPNREEDALA